LIASSVMSKKLASGADAIVLDVKAGTGAFMPDVERAGELARMMVEIGAHNGKQVVALVTRMDQPLGAAVGDAVELAEAVAVLSGGGPADVAELCGVLAAHMLVLGGVSRNLDDGIARAQEGLRTRIGLAKLRQMVIAQGGDPSAIDNPELLSRGLERISIAPDRHGFVAGLDARQIGLAIHDLKAAVGDRKPYCGALLHRKVGDAADGELAVLLHPAGARSAAISAANRIRAAYYVSDTAPPAAPLVAETISSRSL
jgi:thymidine phosphorylase